MAKKLTELVREAVAKSQTEEGRRELLEERERMEAEVLQAAQKAAQAAPETPETAEGVRTTPLGAQETPEVRAVSRIDPVLPVVQVKMAPAREAGRLAFGTADKKNRTRADQDAAWEDLPGVKLLTRTASTPDGGRGWLIVPKDAAAAMQSPEAERSR